MITYDNDSVICALATPPGLSGIAVLRIDGPGAKKVVEKNCPFLFEKNEGHKIYYGFFVDELGREIDEVLVSNFKERKSFTGNELIEVSCHGSSFVAQEILNCLISSGARLAEKGEFTYRAFCNGRIDLAQAESVLSLIHSSSSKQRSVALDQLKGSLSKNIESISESLTLILANLEASIDFSMEDIELASYKEFSDQISEQLDKVDLLLKSYADGKKIKEGFLTGPLPIYEYCIQKK